MSEDDDSVSSSQSDMEITDEKTGKVWKPKEIIPVNDIAGLQNKLEEIRLQFGWIEKLDVSVDFDFSRKKLKGEDADQLKDDKAEHDFKREMAFINQAKVAATQAIAKLKKLGIPIKRPNDYFAEMAKSDEQMTKVRQKLLSKEKTIERIEKVRHLREQKKNAKNIQREVLAKKRSEKKVLMDALKKSKKGKLDMREILEEKKESNQRNQKSQAWKGDNPIRKKGNQNKQKYKNEKYGFGGQKKRSKYNTAESSSYLPGMGQNKFSMGKFGGKNPGQRNKRPRAKSTRRRR